MTADEYQDHVDSYDGICLACGEIKFGDCEPDAEEYECDACGEHAVRGIENALIAGDIEFIEE
jgi:hypothetical protein